MVSRVDLGRTNVLGESCMFQIKPELTEKKTLKMNGWNLKNHPIEKENHLPSTSLVWLCVNFPGCSVLDFEAS